MTPTRLSRARHGLALLLSLRPLGYGSDSARRAQVAAGLLAFLGPVDALPCPARADAVRVHAEAFRWLRLAIHGLRSSTVFGREVQRAIEAGGRAHDGIMGWRTGANRVLARIVERRPIG